MTRSPEAPVSGFGRTVPAFSSTVLVGRNAELASLTGALPGVLAGRPHALVISGTVGIGKTRLALEALAAAQAEGFLTLGVSAAPLEQELSYAPVVRALRPLVDGDRRAELVDGLPSLGRLFDDPELPDPPPDLGDPGLERTRLFEAVRQFVQRATAIQPIALLVDDVHWLDRASQTLLGYLARCLTDSRLLMLLTCRNDQHDDPMDGIPLLEALRLAARRPVVPGAADRGAVPAGLRLSELALSGLDDTELTALAADLLGGRPPDPLVDLLAARSAGVPLFVHALLSTLSTTGALTRVAGQWVLRPTAPDTVPDLARSLLERRLDGLSPTLRRVLDAVCLGGETTVRMVAGIAGTDQDQAIDALGQLCHIGLIDEETAGRTVVYRPSHPMLAEVAVRTLPAEQRQALHAAAARLLEQGDRPDALRLAHHLLGAGARAEPDRTFGVVVDAVATALHRRAGDEAVALARAALDLMAEHRLPGSRERLLTALAHGAQMVGRLDEALAVVLEVADRGHPRTRARHLGNAARIAWDLGRFELADQCLRDARQLIDGYPAGPVHVFLSEVEIRNAGHGDRHEILDAALHRLSDLAERSGLVRARAVLDIGRLIRDLDDGQLRDALARIDGLLSVSRQSADPLFTERVLRSVGQAFLRNGDFDSAADCATEGVALAHRIGVPALTTVHLSHLGMIRLQQGRYAEATALAGQLIETGERLGVARATAFGMTQLAFVARAQGQSADAEALLDQVQDRFGRLADADRHLFGLVDLARTLVQLELGDAVEAQKTARAALARRTPVRALTLEAYGRALADDGRWTETGEVLDELRTQADGKDLTTALADRLAAQLAAARGERDAAAALFAAAADGFDRLGMAVDAAQAGLEAVSRLPADDRATPEWLGTRSPRDLAGRALAVLVASGVDVGADRARRLLRRHGGAAAPPSVRRSRATDLTPRETEVVRLVAAGLTNPQIAERLYISTRTVTTHLQKVYARLGIRSRVAMTRWVAEHLSP